MRRSLGEQHPSVMPESGVDDPGRPRRATDVDQDRNFEPPEAGGEGVVRVCHRGSHLQGAPGARDRARVQRTANASYPLGPARFASWRMEDWE